MFVPVMTTHLTKDFIIVRQKAETHKGVNKHQKLMPYALLSPIHSNAVNSIIIYFVVQIRV